MLLRAWMVMCRAQRTACNHTGHQRLWGPLPLYLPSEMLEQRPGSKWLIQALAIFWDLLGTCPFSGAWGLCSLRAILLLQWSLDAV